jgi:hypothetical protein
MGYWKWWQSKREGLRESLYQVFVRAISDPEQYLQTGMALQWTAGEHQSSWREEQGTFVFERRWAQGGVTRLVVKLDSDNDEGEYDMAEPLYMETVAPGGLKHVYPRDCAETYQIAQTFLMDLVEEAQEFFPACRRCEERVLAEYEDRYEE